MLEVETFSHNLMFLYINIFSVLDFLCFYILFLLNWPVNMTSISRICSVLEYSKKHR